MRKYRYYARSADGRAIYGFDSPQGAETAAREYGDGAVVIDTMALAYEPMVQTIRDGQLLYVGISGWNTNRLDENENMIEGIRNGNVAIVHAFVARGADVNFIDRHGGTPLHWAAAAGNREIIELLLDKGADRLARDRDGEMPLDIARQKKQKDIIEILSQEKRCR